MHYCYIVRHRRCSIAWLEKSDDRENIKVLFFILAQSMRSAKSLFKKLLIFIKFNLNFHFSWPIVPNVFMIILKRQLLSIHKWQEPIRLGMSNCAIYFITLLLFLPISPLISTGIVIFSCCIPVLALLSKLQIFEKCCFNPLNRFLKHDRFWKNRKLAWIKDFILVRKKIICCNFQISLTHGYDPFSFCLVHSISSIPRKNKLWITKFADD